MSRALSPAQIVASDLCIGCGVCASGGEAGKAGSGLPSGSLPSETMVSS